MPEHVLKIQLKPFEDLLSGIKTGEVRNCADRDFKEGDTVRLCLIDESRNTTGSEIVRKITHVQRDYGLPPDLCVLSYAAPVPPAGGEVEVLAWIQSWRGLEWRVDRMKVAPGTELVDRAHVTRLTAERDGLLAKLETMRRKNNELNDTVAEQQSELTKALSWLQRAKPLLHSGGFNLIADDIGNYLAHQSAPAAKGGE